MISQALANINWLHVLVASLAYFSLGAIWYSPVMFATQWTKMHGIKMDSNDPNAKKGMGMMMFFCLVFVFIQTACLGGLMALLPAMSVLGSVKMGIITGLCFCSTAICIGYLYTKKPMGLYFIDSGYQTVGLA